ncbi:MAG: hypothetical protein IPH07_24520 [Deltaproteobacteria bacterium]|nr:hypothetical protein [Deltaproteobacteria bacterium]
MVLSVDGTLTHRRNVTRATIEELFAAPFVGAGVVTELAVLSRHAGTVTPAFRALARGDVYDVLSRQKYLDIAAGRKRPKVSLEIVAPLHAQRKLSEAGDVWRLRYGELFDVPLSRWPSAALDYASEDSRILRPIFDSQEAAGPEGVFVDQHRRACGHWALHLSSLFGMPVDQTAVDAFARGLEELWVAKREQMVAAGFMRPDGTRNKIAALEHAVRVGVTARAKSGKSLSLSKQTCLDSGNAELTAWAEFEHLWKLKTTFVKMLRSRARLRPRYNELLITGRTSASKPNIQQLPRAPGIRECCVADPGHCLISVDVDKAELCALGDIELEFLGKSKLADAINAGVDPHCLLGAELVQLSLAEFMRRYQAGDAEASDARQDVKPANFGLPVRMSPETYVTYARGQGRELSLKRSRQVVAAWKRAYPTTLGYQALVQKLLRRAGGNVRHPRSGLLRGRLRFTQAANGFYQERIASAMLEALWVLACLQWGQEAEGFDAEHFAPLNGTRTLAYIHDEVIVQCPIDQASAVASLVQEVVERVVQKWIPRVRITAGAVAMLRWSKKAKATFDANGRLIPWVPKQ